MGYSVITYTGDGTDKSYSINFPLGYLSKDHITCRVNNEIDGLGDPSYRSLEYITDTLVNINGDTPGDGVPIVFTRTVPKTTLIHDYVDGVSITEQHLDESNSQVLMAIHEFLDGRYDVAAIEQIIQNAQDSFDAQLVAAENTLNGIISSGEDDINALITTAQGYATSAQGYATDAQAAADSITASISTAMEPVCSAATTTAALDLLGGLPDTGVVTQDGAVMSKDFIISGTGTGPVCAFYGDSLTDNPAYAGLNPAYYVTVPTWNGLSLTKVVSGNPGQTALYLNQVAWQKLNAYYAPFCGMNVVVVHGGINDIATGSSAAVAYGRIAELCQHLRTLGWKVLVATLFSCNGYNTQRNQFNTYMYSNWFKFADGLVDYASNSILGQDSSYTNTTYFLADGVHLQAAGNQVAGSVIQAALETFMNNQSKLVLGTGLTFPNVAVSGNTTLDWYQEGTFTPVAKGLTTEGTCTYTAQEGRFTRIGNTVQFRILIGWSGHTGTGALYVDGLPFAAPDLCPVSITPNGLVLTAGTALSAAAYQTRVYMYTTLETDGTLANIQVDPGVVGLYLAGSYFV